MADSKLKKNSFWRKMNGFKEEITFSSLVLFIERLTLWEDVMRKIFIFLSICALFVGGNMFFSNPTFEEFKISYDNAAKMWEEVDRVLEGDYFEKSGQVWIHVITSDFDGQRDCVFTRANGRNQVFCSKVERRGFGVPIGGSYEEINENELVTDRGHNNVVLCKVKYGGMVFFREK